MLHFFRYNKWSPVFSTPQLIGPFAERSYKSFLLGIHPQPRTETNGMFLYVDFVCRQMSTEAVVSFGKVLVRSDDLADLLAVSLFADAIGDIAHVDKARREMPAERVLLLVARLTAADHLKEVGK